MEPSLHLFPSLCLRPLPVLGFHLHIELGSLGKCCELRSAFWVTSTSKTRWARVQCESDSSLSTESLWSSMPSPTNSLQTVTYINPVLVWCSWLLFCSNRLLQLATVLEKDMLNSECTGELTALDYFFLWQQGRGSSDPDFLILNFILPRDAQHLSFKLVTCIFLAQQAEIMEQSVKSSLPVCLYVCQPQWPEY